MKPLFNFRNLFVKINFRDRIHKQVRPTPPQAHSKFPVETITPTALNIRDTLRKYLK